MSAQKELYIGQYNDCYGSMLTDKQRDMVKLYYDLDLSLAEIAEQYDVTRQAVRDCIVRAKTQLECFESKLGFVKKIRELNADINAIIQSEGLDERFRAKLIALAAKTEDF